MVLISRKMRVNGRQGTQPQDVRGRVKVASVRGADFREPKSQGLQGNQPHSMQGRVKVASPALSVVLISGSLSVNGAKGTSPTACSAESRWPLSMVLIPGA